MAQFSALRLEAETSVLSAQAYAIRNGMIGGRAPNPNTQPVVWPSPTSPFQSLAASGGSVYALTDTHQLGSQGGEAAMWSGTPGSYVNLNPVGSQGSQVLAGSATHQGGWTDFLGEDRKATLWSGTPSSAIYLQPPGAFTSSIQAMTETHQGGYVGFSGPQGSIGHAALWGGSTASFMDMNPAGYSGSVINGMFGSQQVGAATMAGAPTRAGMWFGTPESFVNMHPFPTGISAINGTCGSAQVGYMNSGGLGSPGIRAVIWFGTAESVLDLSQFLPAGAGQSIATCIEERDGVFTVGGYARYGATDQAFVWVGVPAPSSVAVLVVTGLVAARRRR